MYYLYCCCIKYDLLNITLITMPENPCRDVSTSSRLYTAQVIISKQENITVDIISYAFSKPIKIEYSKDKAILNTVKRQKADSETYSRLHDKFADFYSKIKDKSLPPFLRKKNQEILHQSESQLDECI